MLSLKDWLTIIPGFFAFLIVPVLRYIRQLDKNQEDLKQSAAQTQASQKADLTATNVQVDQVKHDVSQLSNKVDGSIVKMETNVATLNNTLVEHGKSLSRIEGFLSGSGKTV